MRQSLRHFQEEFELMVVLSDEVSGDRAVKLEEKIRLQSFTREVKFINKEEAASEFMDAVGENFLDIMEGINPMRSTFRIRLKADYWHEDSLKAAKKFLKTQPGVLELVAPDKEIEQIRKNAAFIMNTGLILSAIVVLIAWFLIGGTIRMAVFARRFSIRTMQLIGASDRFIRRPFLAMGLLQGFLGGMIASGLFILLVGYIPYYYPQLTLMKSMIFGNGGISMLESPGIIMLGGIVIFGTLLGFIASRFAVNRFLHQPLENIA